MHSPRSVSSLVLALLLATPVAIARAEPPVSDHANHRHVTVRISRSHVRPEEARIHADEALAWLNYSGLRARVIFPADVAEKLRCTSRGSFALAGDRLVSGEIQGTQFASLCRLEPGTYRYEVEFFNGLGYPPEGSITAQIVVER